MNMKTKFSAITICASLALASTSYAGEVVTNDVTTFEADTPAVAAEVNGNFNALISAINDNAQRIADLEGSQPDIDVAGHTYQFIELEVGLFGRPATVDTGSFGASLLFSNTGTISFDNAGSAVVNGAAFEVEAVSTSDNDAYTVINEQDGASFTFTQSGSTVVLTGEDPLTMHASLDGSVLISRTIDVEQAPIQGGDANVIVAVRIQ